jgi:hypothetical protein
VKINPQEDIAYVTWGLIRKEAGEILFKNNLTLSIKNFFFLHEISVVT